MSSSSSASPISRPLATSNIFTLSSQVAKNFNCDGDAPIHESGKLMYVYQKPSGTTNLECDLKKLGLLDKPEAKIIILNEANIKMTLSDSLPADLPKIRNTFIYKNYKPEGTAVGPAVNYTVNCGTNVALGATSPNAYLCFPGNRFQSSGGVFGSLKFSGQVQPEVGASNPIKLTITQSPDVLPAIQKFLYKNKASIISERKVILKYK
jgi:archaellin